MKKKTITMILFLLLILAIFFNTWLQSKKRKENFEIAKGVVTGTETFWNSGGTVFVKFEFKVGNKNIVSKTSIPCNKSNKLLIERLLVGKNMDVVYEKDDESNCKMLLEKSMYEVYNLKIPDMLSPLIDSIAAICPE